MAIGVDQAFTMRLVAQKKVSDTLRTMKTFLVLIAACWLAGCANHELAGKEATTVVSTAQIYYFPETGHTVQDPFLAYYLDHDGPTRYGYPITEAMSHEGWQVQYFQYARLEVHPENHPDYFITVGWLGQLSHRTTPPLLIIPAESGRHFPETGHTLNGDFLAYFEANGDTVQFGRPISEPFLQQGLLCQDLQSARFCWWPNLQAEARIQLEPIGESYFLSSDLPTSRLAPIAPPPQATLYSTPPSPGPDQVEASLSIETTSRPEIIRLTATLFDNGSPLVGYAPILTWDHQRRQLPPSRSSGQAHLLVDVSTQSPSQFSLLTADERSSLTSIIYQGSPP